ncbi:MATE family efflux transporter, partial [Helicobacter typhlonius]
MSAVSVNDKVDMRKDSIYKLFFYFFIPNLCAMLALSTYSTIDGIFVGKKLGENALAAIGLCWPIFPALIAFELLFGLGAASIASY